MRSILLPVFTDDGFEGRLQTALALARQFNAHITCLQTLPDAGMMIGDLGGSALYYSRLIDEVQQAQSAHRGAIEARLGAEDVTWSWVQLGYDPAQTVASQARLNDLVVLSNATGSALPPGPDPADVILRSPVPSLVIPKAAAAMDVTAPVLIAWNGSHEAAAAMRGALPFLKRSTNVTLITAGNIEANYPASAAASYLSRHDIHVIIRDVPQEGDIPEKLIATARAHCAQMIVMGAYGHTRFREAVFGGATHDMLEHSPIPLFMAH